VATESQRASRGVLEHWKTVHETGVNVTEPEVSAHALKAFNNNSSVGKALKFPARLLGDVYADPNAKKDRSAAAAANAAMREAEAEAFKAERTAGWSTVADDEVRSSAPVSDAPRITAHFDLEPATDGKSAHLNEKSELNAPGASASVADAVEALSAPPAAVLARIMPDVRYADCDNSIAANGAARNCAPTSMFGGAE